MAKATFGVSDVKGSNAVRPRAKTGGTPSGGNFGVKPYAEQHGGKGMHPDRKAGTGMKGPMGDGDRAIGGPIKHSAHDHPAQAAPNHGANHTSGYGKGSY